MHPPLHIHIIPVQTQAHTYSNYQNKTGIIVFLFKHVLMYTLSNLLVVYAILHQPLDFEVW